MLNKNPILKYLGLGLLSLLMLAGLVLGIFHSAKLVLAFSEQRARFTAREDLNESPNFETDLSAGGAMQAELQSAQKPSEAESQSEIMSASSKVQESEKRSPDDGNYYIAITFDDGPHSQHEQRLLKLFEELGEGKATFFWLGCLIPGQEEIVRAVDQAGHEIANHSYSHPAFSQLTAEQITAELEQTNDLFEELIGRRAELVRLPYGDVNELVKSRVPYPMIQWSIDTVDWQSRNVEAIKEIILQQAYPGAVVLAHSIHPETITAMEEALPILYEKGYRFVTVSELFEIYGLDLEANQLYFSAIN